MNGFQVTTDYVLGLGGEQVTEMHQGVWQHTNVFAGGTLLATYDQQGLHFYLNDPLGTRRAQTDYAGNLEQTCASLPFGDDFGCSRSNTSPTEQHFTGKERDSESGDDYFGARYYNSATGRWLSADWSAKQKAVPYAKLDNPQTLNLYGYVGNNPLSQVDADGHFASPWHFLLTFVAAVVTGHDPITAAILGVQNVLVDVGTQGPSPSDTHIHDMGAVGESPQQAYQGTVQTLAGEQAAGNEAAVQHTVQDGFASGHDYSTWPGSFAALPPGGERKHEIGDWLPSPGRLWGALKSSISAFLHPDADPESLLAPEPAATPASAPAPTPPPSNPD